MTSAILNPAARTTGTYPMYRQPEAKSAGFFSDNFWAVTLVCMVGLALAVAVTFASPCTGMDLNAGCVPVQLTGQR